MHSDDWPMEDPISEWGVECRLFQGLETEIRALSEKIKAADATREKAVYATAMKRQAGFLLKCAEFAETRPDCKVCRSLSHLRKTTAGLIIKVARPLR